MSQSEPRTRLLVPLAFACVYFFWGSTFVAIRYSVAFLTPGFVSGFRYLAAGLILLAWFAVRGTTIRLTPRELLRAAILGLLLLTGNNVLLGFAERSLTAGYAALLTASVPMLIACAESAIPGGRPLNRVGWAGTALGLGGLLLLLYPVLRRGFVPQGVTDAERAVSIGTAILLVAIASWVVGTLLSGRIRSTVEPLLSSAWQMCIAGLVNVLIGTAAGGWRSAHWTPGVIAALAWLTLFGSLVGYSAYTYLLHTVSVAKVATYAYVNPIVAVLLSALFLHESLHGSQWFAMAIILVAVATITASKTSQQPARPAELTEAAEAGEAG
ncbi:EamA family transporter [Acidipila sp. EB88]|uniref:EamA family transporter n=1 Tax=Acidipila sp. EB88 TaxID=2305226 RepID=UPI000F5E9FF4|nr:EamA family transporter [Acidipila sp. EB88]RRA48504.1 EamA family transporter [Acidipila sp. EB88]